MRSFQALFFFASKSSGPKVGDPNFERSGPKVGDPKKKERAAGLNIHLDALLYSSTILSFHLQQLSERQGTGSC